MRSRSQWRTMPPNISFIETNTRIRNPPHRPPLWQTASSTNISIDQYVLMRRFEPSNVNLNNATASERQLDNNIDLRRSLTDYKERADIIDTFMMLPLCSEVRTLYKEWRRNTGQIVTAKTRTLMFQRRNKRRKMKVYKLLKGILKPKFDNYLFKRRTSNNNRRYNQILRKILRKLYRNRRRKLRNYFLRDSGPSDIRNRGKWKKIKIIQYIRRYRLNTIFKLFKIRVLPLNNESLVKARSESLNGRTSPVLCLAFKRPQKWRYKIRNKTVADLKMRYIYFQKCDN